MGQGTALVLFCKLINPKTEFYLHRPSVRTNGAATYALVWYGYWRYALQAGLL